MKASFLIFLSLALAAYFYRAAPLRPSTSHEKQPSATASGATPVAKTALANPATSHNLIADIGYSTVAEEAARLPVSFGLLMQPRIANRSHELANEGDTALWLGHKVVREDNAVKYLRDNPENLAAAKIWNNDAEHFLQEGLGLSPSNATEVLDADRRAFDLFRSHSDAIGFAAEKIFGKNIGIVLDGELQKEYNDSYDKYEASLREQLSESAYQSFLAYRKSYKQKIYGMLGWIPDIVK